MKTKALLFALVVAAFAMGTANSSEKGLYYRCTNVGNVTEYTLEVNLNTGKAAFFDNDSWSVLPRKGDAVVPPQYVHLFSGSDAYKSRMTIWFNQATLSGDVYENVGTPEQRRMKAKACKAVKAGDLYSGI